MTIERPTLEDFVGKKLELLLDGRTFSYNSGSVSIQAEGILTGYLGDDLFFENLSYVLGGLLGTQVKNLKNALVTSKYVILMGQPYRLD